MESTQKVAGGESQPVQSEDKITYTQHCMVKKSLGGWGLRSLLLVSIEYLYLGTMKKISLWRNVICSKCNCEGSKSGASMTCSGCQGSGVKVTIRQLGLGMIQQVQHPCNECKGTGETISDKDRCSQYKGDREDCSREQGLLEVHVEKGMQNVSYS